jgi:histidine triad (HIT) family protein
VDCIFCKIVSGQINAKIIAGTDNSVAFMDAFPLTRGHLLVIPKKHHEKIQDLSFAENTDLFGLVHQIISKTDSLAGATLVAIHNGKGAGQEIPHVHVHLIPRSLDDSAGPVHSMFHNRPKLSDTEFDDLFLKLK